MTLHPWPSDDDSPLPASQPILWTRANAVGLLIDTPAIPLRFAAELEIDDVDRTPAAPAPLADPLQARCDAALLRVRELEALVLRLVIDAGR